MHLEETYTGFMRVASNRDGKPYKDWREHYIDQECLTMEEGLIVLENATLYFGEKLELQRDK